MRSCVNVQPTLVLEQGYTELGQLDHLTLRSPDTTSQQDYRYDALGRMSFRNIEGDQASKVIAYSYDAAGRLIGSQHGDHAHRYSVDAAGNRLEQGVDKQQGLTDNRLTQINGTRYRYDGAGNLIERQQPNGERLTLGYDGANRLVHLIHASELGASREATYRYDGLGRRISKTVRHTNGTTATTHYGWDGDRIVREETDKQRTTVVYEPGSFVPMLRIDDTQQGQILSAYITDALGTPMQLVTPNGHPRWLAEPDDWAAVKNQRAARNVTQPIRFQGQWHDEESGLYYNRHRYYDPQQGRYISQDPIGLSGGTNLYGYVTNPTGMVDPLGLSGYGFQHLEPLSIPAGEAQWCSMYPQSQQAGIGEESMFWRAIKTVPRMAGQFYDDMMKPEKETAEAVSTVAAACSVIPAVTVPCGVTSVAAASYAANLERMEGNNRQAIIDMVPTVASETATLIFKRAEIVSDAVSTAIGVGTGFKTQYWINRDNHIDNEVSCEHAE